ncbi:MAG: HYR domain-containing protein [Bacteroidota bacterium]
MNSIIKVFTNIRLKALWFGITILSLCAIQAQQIKNIQVPELINLPDSPVEDFWAEVQSEPMLSKRTKVYPTALQIQQAKEEINQIKNTILSKPHHSISFQNEASLTLKLDLFRNVILESPNGNRMPLSLTGSTSNTIVIEGNHQDNTLIISKEIIDLGYNILYLGGAQQTAKGDQLIVGESTNDRFSKIEISHYNANDGVIEIDTSSTITFMGLEPLTLGGTADDLIINLPNATPNPDAVLQNDAINGSCIISGSTFEATTFLNPANSLTINGGTLEDLISIQGVDTGFGADLIINANSDNDQVSFDTNTTFVGVGEISVVAEFLSITAEVSTEDDITLLADKSIEISNGARVSTSLGDIVITSSQDIVTTDNFTGITINNGQVDSIDGGNITITGVGASDGTTSNNRGVNIANTSSVFTSDSSGAITITGVGGNGTVNNDGVTMSSNNASISSVGGDIVIQGTANGTGNNNAGFAFRGQITNTGGGTIDITATSNGLGSGCRGMRIIDNSSAISTVDGNLSINATAGPGNSNCQGIEYREGIITSEGGDITIIGTGNGSGNENYGLYLNSAINTDIEQLQITGSNVSTAGGQFSMGIRMDGNTNITTQDGQININGTGGVGNSQFSLGVLVAFGADIIATGTGSIAITGNAGASPQNDYGVLLQNNNTRVEANGGGITLNGTGGGNMSSRVSTGVNILAESLVTENGGGDITITGMAGLGTDRNVGFFIATGAAMQCQGGTISINGTGSAGPDGSNFGFGISNGSITNTSSGDIEIIGIGGTGLDDNFGAVIDENAVLTAEDGDIMITGTSIDTATDGAVTIASPITASGLGNITINGTAVSNTDVAIGIASEVAVVTAGASLELNALQGVLNSPDGPATLSVCNAANISINGLASPGDALGQFQLAGALDFTAGSTLTFEINDLNTPGIDFDQLVVNGTVDLTDVNLVLVDNLTATPSTCQFLVLIDNDNADAVVGTFTGIAQGDSVSLGAINGTISYVGGDGNDVVFVFENTQAPTVTCPADITVDNDAGVCGATVTFTSSATDDCAGVTITAFPPSGSVFPVGTTDVLVTATDASGNTDTCTFTITVNDTEAPILNCPADITAECIQTITYSSPTFSDNCAIAGAPPAAVPGFTLFGTFGNSTYFISDTADTAANNFAFANANNYKLVTIGTQEENDFITSELNSQGTGSVLIGYNDLAVEDDFVWQSG